jgi:hypothetical protein
MSMCTSVIGAPALTHAGYDCVCVLLKCALNCQRCVMVPARSNRMFSNLPSEVTRMFFFSATSGENMTPKAWGRGVSTSCSVHCGVAVHRRKRAHTPRAQQISGRRFAQALASAVLV